MRNLRDFDNAQQAFIKFCLRAGASNRQITHDLCEMLGIPEYDKPAHQNVYKQVQGTREGMSADEIGCDPIDNISDTPQWRKMYLRCLLSIVKDEKLKVKILSDIRSEDRLIAKSGGRDAPDDDTGVAEDKEQDLPFLYTPGECPSIENVPDFDVWEWDGWGMHDVTPKDCYKHTFLPRDEYDFIMPQRDEDLTEDDFKEFIRKDGVTGGYFVRKSDGEKVWEDGLPLTPEEEKTGVRIDEWDMCGPDGSGIFPRWTIARNAYLRNYYHKRGLQPPPDDVFDADVYACAGRRPAGWWHEQRRIKTRAEQLIAAKTKRRNT